MDQVVPRLGCPMCRFERERLMRSSIIWMAPKITWMMSKLTWMPSAVTQKVLIHSRLTTAPSLILAHSTHLMVQPRNAHLTSQQRRRRPTDRRPHPDRDLGPETRHGPRWPREPDRQERCDAGHGSQVRPSGRWTLGMYVPAAMAPNSGQLVHLVSRRVSFVRPIQRLGSRSQG